ncbi:DedA family protein [Actinoalloteichus hymeniacidonis]|uniref:VTT domain-containing protein n=1 Tax=Actinoalloteichus hymeniacidonis TaxID=340345 RepID=A0AAC9MZD8_9PSEU|nr:DedA family protein [Actinoalloteichus hymeniacidonis]AOS64364.1 hypothetical protein TL08_17820 [Actinoalloteichus hymeniacidonis]MBB5907568.1 membrane protein DedA with SNARE-associated domain [Actinoalloteichus hymeniacidonis]
MGLLTEALNALAELPQPLVIAVTGLLVLGETTLGLGFLVPGETGLLIAATTVRDPWAFAIMCLVVTVCAGIGDSIGYWLGRRFGPRLRETKLIRKIGQNHWDSAGELLRKHGVWAVFFARFLPVVRTLTPAASGASGLPYRYFLPGSVLGAACWSVLHVGIGAGAGASAAYIEERLGTASWILLVALAVVVTVVIVLKSRKAKRTKVAPIATAPVSQAVAAKSVPVADGDDRPAPEGSESEAEAPSATTAADAAQDDPPAPSDAGTPNRKTKPTAEESDSLDPVS